MPVQTTPSLRFSIQFISLAAQSGSSAKPIATVLSHSHSPPFKTIPSPTLGSSELFRYLSCPSYSVTTLVDSMFFPCYSRLFAPFLRQSNSRLFGTHLFQHNSSQIHRPFLSPHYDSATVRLIAFAYLCNAISKLLSADTSHSVSCPLISSAFPDFSKPLPF
nr:MAG TPA_asm: hypothetical protein [Bacteriophage sp.]